jgi:hypothetical protein
MEFTPCHGVLRIRLRTGPFQESAGVEIFQAIGNKFFFRQQSVYGAVEKQARNRGVSGHYQAPDGGDNGPARSPKSDPERRNSNIV